MAEQPLAPLVSRGYGLRVVSIRRLEELKAEIEDRHREDQLDDGFYREWLSDFDSPPPKSMPHARCAILVAAPQFKRRLVFHQGKRKHTLILPPTYCEAVTRAQVQRLLARLLRPAGHRVAAARLPKKLLAARSGMAEYGRNNLAYMAGMGSFVGLEAFYSDLPAPHEPAEDTSGRKPWGPPRMLRRCSSCSECRRRCPTGAIPSEGFLLRAERCLTLHNEHPTSVPFPAWVDPSWHNCIVGCLRCQETCPENRTYLDRFRQTVRFSDRQTRLLLQGAPAGALPRALTRKLDRAGLRELVEVLPRNLRVMLGQLP